jgi:UDP-3-O-[3-hydroxymyristoyl] glucosamine N-acyltransferase
MLAGQVGVAGHLTIGDRAIITAQSGVLKSVPPGETWGGFPSRPQKETMRGYAAVAKLPDLLKRLEALLAREKGS